MIDDALCWKAEEACTNAWPSQRQVLLGGWLLRQSGGRMRRPNSVSPMAGPRRDPGAVVAEAEALYRAHGQEPIFRIMSIADAMEPLLDSVAYPHEGHSLTIAGDLGSMDIGDEPMPGRARASADWFAARHRLAGDAGTPDASIFEAMLDMILIPTAFASSSVDGEIASLAYGAVQGKLLVIESVVTDPNHRGKGLARRTLASLFGWGRSLGAETVCLQVIADNEPALRLYRGLGLRQTLFAYHYRRGTLPLS